MIVGGESPPSPVGTPEELNFSSEEDPDHKEEMPVTTNSTETVVASSTVEAPPTTMPAPVPVPTQSSGSLDSRLTNLMENMQKLPAGVFSTLFGKNKPNSPVKEVKNGSPVVGGTPLNDEPSGHETPLQDEAADEVTADATTENLSDQAMQVQGIPMPPTLVSNNGQDWVPPEQPPTAAAYSWGIPGPYTDKDERVSSAGTNIMPMDMELDDAEMEDAPGAIIEAAVEHNNLITVVNADVKPDPEIPPTDTSTPDVVPPVDDLAALENDNKIFQETRRQMSAVNNVSLKADNPLDDFPLPNIEPVNDCPENNFMNNEPCRPPFYPPGPPQLQNNFRMFQNDGNSWGNNFNRPRRPMFRGRPHPRPYRLPPPPRWPY